MKLRAGLALCVFGLATISTVSAEDWVVATSHVQCLIDHVGSYNSSGNEVLMIVLSACPEPDINKALASLTQNNAVPGIAVGGGSASDIDDVVVYTPTELTCLSSLPLDLSGQTTRLPKQPVCQ